jgi:hypothetical protein
MSEKSKRINALLAKAAQAFIDGNDPFSSGWLSENDVTLDECMSLSNQIGAIIKGYAASPRETQMKILVAHALDGSGLPPEFAKYVNAQIDMDATIKKLKGTKP